MPGEQRRPSDQARSHTDAKDNCNLPRHGAEDTKHASVQHDALPEAAWASPEAKVCKVQAARVLCQLLRQILELVRSHVCAAHQQHLGVAGQQQGSGPALQARGKAYDWAARCNSMPSYRSFWTLSLQLSCQVSSQGHAASPCDA